MNTCTRQRLELASLALLLSLLPASARAAGFAIFEQGAKGMGFAGAFTAQASDPSAIFHNAAGIGFLKGDQVYLGGNLIFPRSDFTGANPFPGTAVTETGDVSLIAPPSAYYTHQFSERFVVGVGLDVPFGLKTQWANLPAYSGRFISKHAELKGFALNPTIALKLADRLSVGAGLDVRFSSVLLERNIPSTSPFTLKVVDVAAVSLSSSTKTALGFNVGLLAKPTDALALGVSYRHKVKTDYDGTATFTLIPTGNAQFDGLVARSIPAGNVNVTTSVETPSFVSGGLAYTWNEWIFEGDVNWYQWSSFDALPLTFTGHPELSQTIAENYENTFQFRFGLERKVNDQWAVRGGYVYDKSPTPAASVSPLLPDSDRHGVAVGATWKTGRFRVDVANLYLFFKERSTEGVNRDNFNGTYKSSAELFSVSIGYGF